MQVWKEMSIFEATMWFLNVRRGLGGGGFLFLGCDVGLSRFVRRPADHVSLSVGPRTCRSVGQETLPEHCPSPQLVNACMYNQPCTEGPSRIGCRRYASP